MTKPYDVKITIQSTNESQCPLSYRQGQSWLIEGYGKTPEGLCLRAYQSLNMVINVLRYGGKPPLEFAGKSPENKNKVYQCCTSANNTIVFQLERDASEDKSK